MHPEALDAVKRMTTASGYTKLVSGPLLHPRIALDIGGADVNGSARAMVPAIDTWIGLDITAGPGVDVVADATDLNSLRMPPLSWRPGMFDVILCTEVLEHVENWRAIVSNVWHLLARDGFAFITAAGCGPDWGRRPHGARGELDPPIGEHYENVNAEELCREIEGLAHHDANPRCLGKFGVMSRPVPGDVYAWIRKD